MCFGLAFARGGCHAVGLRCAAGQDDPRPAGTLQPERGRPAWGAYLEVAGPVVEGPAVLAGLGTGRAAAEEPFSAASVTLFHGRALAIVRPTGPGEIRIRVSAEGYRDTAVSVRAE
ncbi:hypothetical protein ACF044_05125 [Microbacterium sp. NPDC016588]